MRDAELLPDDVAASAAILAKGSKSFATAGLLLPRRVREPASVLYAFCRIADDLVDGDTGPRAGAIAILRDRLDRIYAGRPVESPVDRALAVVARRAGLPRTVFDALIEGFEWDATGRRYETIEALEAYCARVASTVGVLMTLLMGERDPVVLARATDLGVAMQLTNIARDVGEDARNGRIYLPLAWLAEEGVDLVALLAEPRFSPALGAVVKRLLDHAQTLYVRSDAGIPGLPGDCRVAIRAARLIYSDIGRVVAARGYDSVSRRAVVSTPRKLWLLARAFGARFFTPAPITVPALPSVRFLVEATQ
jgi:phytoene synthase